jgi:flagellar biosynthetic protein FliR
MRGELVLSISTLLGFLLTLVRVGGVFIFVPLPGINSVIHPARVILTMGITLALFPEWPYIANIPSAGLFFWWVMVEAGLGLGIGLTVAFVSESLGIGAHLMGVPAGFGFAATIDPNTQADSTVLVIFSQLAAGLLFFATGIDRDILRVFARSLETWPAGTFVLSRGAAEQVLSLGSNMMATGFRLALPMIAVLMMVDISLALLGRINAQLHLTAIAFPIKMMIGMMLFAWLTLLLPTLFRAGMNTSFSAMRGLIAH